MLPQIGQFHAEGFIDTGSEIESSAKDSHVYVSVVAVRELAKLIGWVDPAELAQERDDLAARVEALEGELASQDAVLEAIDTLESADYRARRKPGRAKKQVEEAVA